MTTADRSVSNSNGYALIALLFFTLNNVQHTAPGLVWMGGKSHPHRDSVADR